MKKIVFGLAAVLLVGLLAACGTQSSSVASQPEQSPASSAAAASTPESAPVQPEPDVPAEPIAPDTTQEPDTPEERPAEEEAPAVPLREPTTTLEYYLEGEPTQTQAALFSGEGYSLYIPVEGWLSTEAQLEGAPARLWCSEVNDAVCLSVIWLAEQDIEQARQWVRTAAPGYDLLEDARGGMGGMDAADQMLDAMFYPTQDGVYVLVQQYPLEAAEGFGTRMSVFADTFELTNE